MVYVINEKNNNTKVANDIMGASRQYIQQSAFKNKNKKKSFLFYELCKKKKEK